MRHWCSAPGAAACSATTPRRSPSCSTRRWPARSAACSPGLSLPFSTSRKSSDSSGPSGAALGRPAGGSFLALARRAREEAPHHRAPVQAYRAVLAVAHLHVGWDAQDVIDGCSHVVGREGCRGGVGTDLVRFADHLTAAHAGAGEQAEEARRPVVPAGGLRAGLRTDL